MYILRLIVNVTFYSSDGPYMHVSRVSYEVELWSPLEPSDGA